LHNEGNQIQLFSMRPTPRPRGPPRARVLRLRILNETAERQTQYKRVTLIKYIVRKRQRATIKKGFRRGDNIAAAEQIRFVVFH